MNIAEAQFMASAGTDSSEQGGITPPVRLLIVDDHDMIRWALRAMLADEPNLEVVGEAKDGHEALVLCRKLRPDLVLMDVSMPGMDGLEATRKIKDEHPEVVVMMVTAFEDPDYLLEAIKAGAAGYVLKHADRDQLIGAIQSVLAGESPLNQDLAMQLLRRLAKEDRRPTPPPGKSGGNRGRHIGLLSPREMDVLTLLAAGKTNRRIAGDLYLSLSTVKGHIERIISKLEVSDRTQAAVKAVELGLLPEREEG
jgi:DNA-binding NarL/FixJ family response regulator